ncbi:siderophore-interacting protein [Gordonia sp. CPCC 205515]|uniref:siderophore-interacting protein n=1 Tax=Gordonia sp. CPCC 205515 TaxID=3140791 RepID=UPI003AF34CA2
MYDLVPRTVEVVAVKDLSPELRRVTFEISSPQDFWYVDMAPDDHVKLFFADPETGEITMPGVGPDGMKLPAEGHFPIYRDYTVRGYDRELGRLDIEFVLHEHGVAGAWAGAAAAGDRLGMLGPRGSHNYPPRYDTYVLGADETAVPALARWMGDLPADKRVIAFVEVAGPESEVELPERDGAEVHFVHRNGADPGNSPLIDQALRSADLPDDNFYVWVAGEANSLKPIRRYLRRELGLPKERVKVDGYWRSGTVNLDHHSLEED